MKVPGRFDGSHYDDLRLIHLPIPIMMWYAKYGTWEEIIKVNSGEVSTSVWLKCGTKHTWKAGGYQQSYTLTESIASTKEKLRSYPVRLPEVPKDFRERYTRPTPEQIYALLARLSPQQQRKKA